MPEHVFLTRKATHESGTDMQPAWIWKKLAGKTKCIKCHNDKERPLTKRSESWLSKYFTTLQHPQPPKD